MKTAGLSLFAIGWIFFGANSFLMSQGLSERNRYSSIDIGLSNAYFLGSDLPFRANRSFSPGISLAVMTKQTGRLSNGFRYSYNNPTSKSIGRKDSLSDYTFVYYQTRIHKYEFFLKIELIKHLGRLQKRPDLIPYIHVGIGWITFKQKMRYGYDDKIEVSDLTNKTYQRRSMVLPLGVGVTYKLSKFANLSFEIIYNKTFANQLDLDYLKNFSCAKGRDSYLNLNLLLMFM